MKRDARMWITVALTLVLAACAGGVGMKESPIPEVEGNTAYTQRNLWVVQGEHEATNYRMGNMIPVNSKVRIQATTGSTITARVVDSGTTFTIINVPEYTKLDLAALYDRYFASSPQDLGRFSTAERRAIQEGNIERGMSKQAVLIARGYPPAHRTPSIESDSWRYWKGQHDTRVIKFANGEVTEIVD